MKHGGKKGYEKIYIACVGSSSLAKGSLRHKTPLQLDTYKYMIISIMIQNED